MQNLGSELEGLSSNYATFEDDANVLQENISKSLYEKQRSVDLTNKYARMMKRYEDCREVSVVCLSLCVCLPFCGLISVCVLVCLSVLFLSFTFP